MTKVWWWWWWNERGTGGLTQAVGAVYGEAHEDDVSVWVGQGPQPVVVLLTCRIPQSQLHLKDT